jgi:hypothetical protein
VVLNSFQQAVGRELSVKNSKLQGNGLQLSFLISYRCSTERPNNQKSLFCTMSSTQELFSTAKIRQYSAILPSIAASNGSNEAGSSPVSALQFLMSMSQLLNKRPKTLTAVMKQLA